MIWRLRLWTESIIHVLWRNASRQTEDSTFHWWYHSEYLPTFVEQWTRKTFRQHISSFVLTIDALSFRCRWLLSSHSMNKTFWFHESNNWSRAQCSSQIRKGYSEKQVMSGFLPSIDNNLQHSKVFVDPMVILLGEKESWSGVMWFVCYPSFPWIQSQCPPFLPARFQIVKD